MLTYEQALEAYKMMLDGGAWVRSHMRSSATMQAIFEHYGFPTGMALVGTRISDDDYARIKDAHSAYMGSSLAAYTKNSGR